MVKRVEKTLLVKWCTEKTSLQIRMRFMIYFGSRDFGSRFDRTDGELA